MIDGCSILVKLLECEANNCHEGQRTTSNAISYVCSDFPPAIQASHVQGFSGYTVSPQTPTDHGIPPYMRHAYAEDFGVSQPLARALSATIKWCSWTVGYILGHRMLRFASFFPASSGTTALPRSLTGKHGSWNLGRPPP